MSLTPAKNPKSKHLYRVDEIDMNQIASALRRRYKWVVSGAGAGIILSVISLLNTDPIYQGEFQIVIDQGKNAQNNANLFSQNSTLARVAGVAGIGNDSIATEVAILNSPSVLLPVFEAVKENKQPEVAKEMKFREWSKSAITAEEEKGTSILNVQFRDTDKALVLPITELLSKTYQKYSYRGRDRELANLIAYLENQIQEIKPQSDASYRAAIDFGFNNDLGLSDGLPLSSKGSTGVNQTENNGNFNTEVSASSIEASRSSARQLIRSLKVQIAAAENAGAGSIYFASQLAATTDKSSTFDKLTFVETRISELKSRLRDNDPLIKKLERERTSLISYINQQTIALLSGQLELANAKLRSLDRPKGVLAQHRELTQKALLDEATLVTLRNQLNKFKLEQARESTPWELISTPTMLDRPISPIKRQIISMGFLAGLVFGSIGALIRDRLSDCVFSSDELDHYLPGNLLGRLYNQDTFKTNNTWKSLIQLLIQGPLHEKSSIAIVPVGEVMMDKIDDFAAELRNCIGSKRELIVSKDLLTTIRADTQLLVTSSGAATRSELRQLREQLTLQGSPVAGWILLDSSTNKSLHTS